ncbi:unnamed protein product [Toxocara canis]|uniref:Pecanex-like protein n=1 Tax=Toxocara canis TaxID=6265 RepID=A0A183UBW4_TOXCA|nr:unnamed protein product [Toxocara canis]
MWLKQPERQHKFIIPSVFDALYTFSAAVYIYPVFIVYVGNVSVGTAEGCVGDSRMERDWVIFVYGDQHQHVINHKLVRLICLSDILCVEALHSWISSAPEYLAVWAGRAMLWAFSKLFFEKSSAFVVLRLSPDPSFCFTKNKSMALEEARELLEEQQPGSLLLLMVFINDSISNFFSAFGADCMDSFKGERSVSMDFCESFGEQAFILHLKGDEFVVASQDSSYAAVLRWLREMAHCIGEYENRTDEHPASTQRSREHEVMEEDETESDTLLGFDKLMRILDEVDRLKKPLAEVDMLTDIDVTPVHNRLSKPWPSRQWNGKLLRLVCAAVSTKLPDLQQSVAAFIDGLFTVEFPQQVFFNGICPAVRSSSFWDWDMVYSLCDLLQLLQIAIPFNPHGLAILVENVEWFMERLPDRFWMEAPEEARNEINALAKSFHVRLLRQRRISIRMFQESISRQRVSVEEEYRPAWEVCDEMEPPGDFRMLPVQLMRNDIIRPVRPYIRRNKDSGGFNDMEEYLDIQFRLLREDFVCPMRDGIAVWKQHACDDTFLLQFRDAYEQLDLLIIEGVRIEGVQLKRSSGEILRYAKFQPTADVLDRSSKKLKFGQMIALSSDNFKEEALFATIVERPDDQLLEGRIGLSFTAESESHVSKAKIYTIVESNAYFEMYQHVFEVIKHFNSDMPVPFARYLVNAETNVKLPAYLERPLPTDTTVDSEHVNGPTELSVMGTKYPIKRLMYTLDGDKLGIDGYQRNALISALTSELAIVQGPPGTGKTFIGRLIVRVLFENMNLWNPARAYPVLVVCYTNHALDQFLEGLLNDFEEAGVSNDYPSIPEEAFSEWLTMGPSADEERSARRELPIDDDITKDEYIVKSLSQTQLLDGVRRELEEGKMQWDVEESIPIVNHSFSKTNGGTRGEGDVAADEMAEQMTWKQIEETLLQSEVDNGDYYHMGLWDLDENERASRAASVTIFPPRPVHGQSSQKVRYDPGIVARLNARKEDILKVVALSAPEAESIKDIGTLHRDRRWMLYAFWIEQLKQLVEKELASLILKYQKHMVVVKAAFEKLDEIVLRRALVIGATTTGAAKSRSLLRRLGCRVVIVEEAAEVLEAHVLASIPDQCEHAILIGDHQQLKPNPAVHLLAKEYKLEISMFERLIKNNFPHSSLVYQHRMAPCISAPLMPHFYPSLEDAENVKVYPRVKGCVNSIFFMSHREPETATVSSSHCNEFEGDFAVELASYLCKQGYLCDQITVLCTYSAQTAYVRALVQTRFGPLDGPRVDTVDNYQGEENDIVILCLVRSCPSATIGFLAESNRICVALSRAKIGFYMIGNIDFLAYRSHLWSKIGRSLQENNCLGETFSIICTIHGTVQVKAVSNAKEFKLKSPNGGCGLACGVQLNCGHLCQRSCHAIDVGGAEVQANIMLKLVQSISAEFVTFSRAVNAA